MTALHAVTAYKPQRMKTSNTQNKGITQATDLECDVSLASCAFEVHSDKVCEVVPEVQLGLERADLRGSEHYRTDAATVLGRQHDVRRSRGRSAAVRVLAVCEPEESRREAG